ncbi:sensor histidine kinase [Woodsholea maritima]|uniref:sensor histidine kinase n=1 Tax=Woodsholea maritima TaxID=240237 RepID=UPI00035C19DA|nr:PAS domain-containing sensor histidine kinase [Woodsholea maritima]
MIIGEPVHLATLAITGGAVAFGVATSLWAYRLTTGARAAQKAWRERVAKLEEKVSHADSLFGVHPGLVLVWDAAHAPNAHDWGAPRVYGSPTALATMLRFADLNSNDPRSNPAGDLLNSIGDFEARSTNGDDTSLRQKMSQLVEDGTPFSLSISGPSGRFIEADGRTAAHQVVIWLTDSTIRGLEEANARVRLEAARQTVSEDPLAFLDMLGRAPIPAWRINAHGKLEWVNPAYARTVEARSASEVLEDQILIDHSVTELAAEALRTGHPARETRNVIVDGERRTMEISIFPVSGGAAGFAFDITEGEDAKSQLRHFRQSHDDTLNQMVEAVAIFDRGRRLVFSNQAFSKLFKLDDATLTERPTHGALLDRLREKRLIPEQADYARWKSGELAHYEQAPNQETPDELWPLPNGQTLRVARQRHPMGGLLLIFQDMTDELALQARYNTLINVQRATLDRLHEAVAVFGSDGRLRLHNAAFESLWQLDPEALDGVAFDDIAHRSHGLYPNSQAWADLKARITDPSPDSRQPTTGEVRRADDRILTFVTRPLPDGATLIAWDDVSDSRRIETALRERAEALAASDRIKTEFVEHVSYQLRTPLTTIGGYADLLAHGFAGELNDRQKDHMGAIQTASEQLAKLIDDILDIAAIDAGQLELDIEETSLAQTAAEAMDLIASRAEHGGIKIALDTEGATRAIQADPKRIKQILYNLLTNALDHVEPGGKIEIGADVDGDGARLWVADDGEGISEDAQARVFERFQSGEGGGAGLGLSLVNDMVKLHNGWVDLESVPGEGTRVTCHFPRPAHSLDAPVLIQAQEQLRA